ncbi:MAG: ATP-dependent helicase HrpB [Rhodospirillales bacterium]|nr:ATP-dependent helicase HrpB [Rhodospirillales bacterium]
MLLPDLPVSEALPALQSTLAAGRNALLIAPPGAGKTTLAPLALLDAPWLAGQRIVMLEPRRLATRAAATRMASLLGEAVGGTVGFRTRVDRAVSAATRIEVITEGLLIRRLIADPGLAGIGLVILDEVHERSLEADLALALTRDLQRQLRPELRILAMSATADVERLAVLLEAVRIESAGRMHPVTMHHAARDIATVRDLPAAMAGAIRTALAAQEGDILAFLPGMGDIRRTAALLADSKARILALHGELAPAEQDRALAPDPGGARRVVLASAIAETSLTVPGIRIVIDGGFRRAPRLDPSTGLARLTTLRISRAAAAQRAGRAGREAPGVAIRLWSEALHRGLPAQDRPEILESELSGLLLDCLAWGTAPADLPFADPPPAGALAAATALLDALGATRDGTLTPRGAAMAELGAHPRLAALMLAAGQDGPARALAASIAALLEERDVLRPPPGMRSDALPADLGLRLAALEGAVPPGTEIDRAAAARIRRGADQYRRRMAVGAAISPAGDPAPLLAAAFPDRIAQPRGEKGSFRFSGGGGGKLARNDALAEAKLLVVAALSAEAGARIRLAAPLDPASLPSVLTEAITETTETTLDPATGAVITRRRRRLGALILSDRTQSADRAEAGATLLDALRADGLRALSWTPAARNLQARVALMRAIEPAAGWPDLSDAALVAHAETWLAPHLAGITRLADCAGIDLAAALRGMLDWLLQAALDRALPSHVALPGGQAAIDYTQPVPLLSARAQHFYGLRQTPRLADGRVPLRLALLSPAGRPIAITADLAGFWASAWADARRDMRGRYPRHDWPEDGAAATPRTRR